MILSKPTSQCVALVEPIYLFDRNNAVKHSYKLAVRVMHEEFMANADSGWALPQNQTIENQSYPQLSIILI